MMALVMALFYLLFFDTNRKSYVGWIVLAVGFVLGLVIGFLLVKFIKVGAFLFAAWGGFTLGIILWNTFIYLSGQLWVMWVSSIAIAIIFGAIGIPIEVLGVLMVFDRILDMCRTSINVWGDCCCATIVARLEGEKTNVAL